MKILLVNNRLKENTELMAFNIAEDLKLKGIEVAFDNGYTRPEAVDDIDLIMVLGGDGTILRAARHYAIYNVPVLGVNMGTVGFLSHIEVAEIEACIDKFIRGDYVLDERMMLEINVLRNNVPVQKVHALNELVVRSKNPRLISFSLYLNKNKIADYKGDGVIIATPTGTTAYSLSAGGPLLEPDLEVMVITPLASYVLGRRPVVVSGENILHLTDLHSEEIIVYADGQTKLDFMPGDELFIKKADYKLKMVDVKGRPFFSNIDSRLSRN
ncbi:NAD(+)/NADH kinase [Thermosyntropha sp.]|uniref:NAD(+)/NADH kinase n=1 Tax=Thermosyntropha sp. TaxID=2740820 RepID=UPI0025E22748|nr:NAD(+)/NADH kinase [Thermosyntropha sp.]MBO8159187.1 NAD(+)/NADH kinase [Thermosyntropha sp.]